MVPVRAKTSRVAQEVRTFFFFLNHLVPRLHHSQSVSQATRIQDLTVIWLALNDIFGLNDATVHRAKHWQQHHLKKIKKMSRCLCRPDWFMSNIYLCFRCYCIRKEISGMGSSASERFTTLTSQSPKCLNTPLLMLSKCCKCSAFPVETAACCD